MERPGAHDVPGAPTERCLPFVTLRGSYHLPQLPQAEYLPQLSQADYLHRGSPPYSPSRRADRRLSGLWAPSGLRASSGCDACIVVKNAAAKPPVTAPLAVEPGAGRTEWQDGQAGFTRRRVFRIEADLGR